MSVCLLSVCSLLALHEEHQNQDPKRKYDQLSTNEEGEGVDGEGEGEGTGDGDKGTKAITGTSADSRSI